MECFQSLIRESQILESLLDEVLPWLTWWTRNFCLARERQIQPVRARLLLPGIPLFYIDCMDAQLGAHSSQRSAVSLLSALCAFGSRPLLSLTFLSAVERQLHLYSFGWPQMSKRALQLLSFCYAPWTFLRYIALYASFASICPWCWSKRSTYSDESNVSAQVERTLK